MEAIQPGRRGVVMVVDDDESVARTVKRYLANWSISHAWTGAEGVALAEAIEDLALAIVDLNLPDTAFDAQDVAGSCFAHVARIRAAHSRAPVVVFSAHVTPPLVNAAQRLGVEYIVKQDYRENLTLLAERLDLAELTGGWQAAVYLQRLRGQCRLSPRQVQVAAMATRGLRVAEIATALAIGRNSVKRHSENLRQKTGHLSLRALAREAHGKEP